MVMGVRTYGCEGCCLQAKWESLADEVPVAQVPLRIWRAKFKSKLRSNVPNHGRLARMEDIQVVAAIVSLADGLLLLSQRPSTGVAPKCWLI